MLLVPLLTAILLAGTSAVDQPVVDEAPSRMDRPVDDTAAATATEDAASAQSPGLLDRLRLKTLFRASAWTHDRELNDETLTVIGGMRARVAPSMGAFDGFAEGFVQADSVDGTQADLVEGWLRWTSGDFSLKAGHQIIVWGRADRLNPSDVLSSRDYTLLVANDDGSGAAPPWFRPGSGSAISLLMPIGCPNFATTAFRSMPNPRALRCCPTNRSTTKANLR